jgi:hypothetical protein
MLRRQQIILDEWADQTERARFGPVSVSRLMQIMNLLNLAPDIQEELLFLEPSARGREAVTERHLREIAADESWDSQRGRWRSLLEVTRMD